MTGGGGEGKRMDSRFRGNDIRGVEMTEKEVGMTEREVRDCRAPKTVLAMTERGAGEYRENVLSGE